MTKSRDLGNLAQTVAVNLPTALGTAGQSLVVNSGADGLEFGEASGGSMTIYNDLNGTDGTPSGYTYLTNASSPANGDLAFVTANNTVYVRAASGWRKIATVQESPSAVTGQAASYPDIGQNATTDITLSTTDPEGFDVTWSYVVGGNGTLSGSNINNSNGDTLASIAVQTANSNSGGTNTITYRVTRQTTTIAGNFTITFTATDSQSTGTSDTGAISFEISFVITDSRYTSLLMATDGSAGDNDNFTNSSTGGQTLTAYNGPYAGTFSPYREGGYSAYFDGSGDWLQLTGTALGNGDFTVEAWVWLDTLKDYNLIYDDRATGSSATGLALGVMSTGAPYLYTNNGFQITSSQTCTAQTWHHISLVRSSGVITIYLDGTSGGTYSSSANFTDTNLGIGVARTYTVTSQFGGYIRDVRAVVGSAITPPSGGPSERLTAVTGTSLLTCHLPYFADGSSSAHTITVSGNPETRPVGPYNDPEEYSEANNGGSIYFSTADNVDGSYITAGTYTLGATATINFWMYPTESTQKGSIIDANGAGNTQSEFQLFFNPSLYIEMRDSSATYKFINSNLIFPYKVWSYVSLVREAEYIKFYLNGVLKYTENVGTGQFPFDLGHTTYIGRRQYSDTFSPYSYWPYVGYLSDMQFIGGTAVTPTPSTVPTAPLSSSGTSLHIKGTDAHVLDKSQVSNLKLVGNAVAVTSASSPTPPNNTNISLQNSVFLDGSGDCVSITPGYDDPIFNFGTHDWTIEVWAYFKNLTSTRTFLSFLRAGTNEAVPHFYTDGGAMKYYVSGSDRISSASNALTLNTWHHVALSRNGNDHKLYVDGYQVGSTWTSAQTYVQGRPVLGDYHSSLNTLSNSTVTLHGYAQDFRITKGLARYTAADESSSIPSAPLEG